MSDTNTNDTVTSETDPGSYADIVSAGWDGEPPKTLDELEGFKAALKDNQERYNSALTAIKEREVALRDERRAVEQVYSAADKKLRDAYTEATGKDSYGVA
jgi:hypothetical protein